MEDYFSDPEHLNADGSIEKYYENIGNLEIAKEKKLKK